MDLSHVVYAKVYTDGSARLADTSLTSADIYKWFLQHDNLSDWQLTGVNPNVWVQMIPAAQGATIYDILAMSDFPAAAGGVRTLVSGRYNIKNSLSTSDRFLIPDGATVTFTMEDQRFNTFEYTGTGTLFTAGNSFLTMEKTNILMSGNGAQFIEQPIGTFVYQSGRMVFSGTGGALGNLGFGPCRINDMNVENFADGLVINSTIYGLITETVMFGISGGTGTFISILGNTGFFGMETANVFFTGPGHKALYIDPQTQNPINISKTLLPTGLGSFYESGTTGPIASFTDVSTSPTAVAVTNDSGDALYTAVAHGLNVGETAVHSTFTETSYNGTDIVTAVPTADTYKVGKSYVSDDSGLFATTTCQVNDVGHGLSNTQTLSIFGTINFGGGYKIFNVAADTFEITLGKAFPGSESTGNWDTGSLEGSGAKRSKYVVATNNGEQQDSANIGSFQIGGNAEPTSITVQHQFENLNLDDGAVEAGDIELWTLTDSDTGEIRYDGLTPVNLHYTGLVAASSAGGSQRFDFRLLQNGSPLGSPDNVDIPVDINGNVRSSPLLWPIEIQPGDLFRVQVANREGTSNVTINTLKVIIS
jgi:hypothetical protein